MRFYLNGMINLEKQVMTNAKQAGFKEEVLLRGLSLFVEVVTVDALHLIHGADERDGNHVFNLNFRPI